MTEREITPAVMDNKREVPGVDRTQTDPVTTNVAEESRKEAKADYESATDRLKYEANGETANDPEGGYITYIQNNVPDGQGGIKEIVHGPMPRSEWAAYSKEKGL